MSAVRQRAQAGSAANDGQTLGGRHHPVGHARAGGGLAAVPGPAAAEAPAAAAPTRPLLGEFITDSRGLYPLSLGDWQAQGEHHDDDPACGAAMRQGRDRQGRRRRPGGCALAKHEARAEGLSEFGLPIRDMYFVK